MSLSALSEQVKITGRVSITDSVIMNKMQYGLVVIDFGRRRGNSLLLVPTIVSSG